MEYDIVFNCNTGKRHYAEPYPTNRTLCGLSLKKGHAWDKARVPWVTCAQCEHIAWKREMGIKKRG